MGVSILWIPNLFCRQPSKGLRVLIDLGWNWSISIEDRQVLSIVAGRIGVILYVFLEVYSRIDVLTT